MTVASQDLTAQDGNNLSGSHGNIHAEYEDMWITKKVKDSENPAETRWMFHFTMVSKN